MMLPSCSLCSTKFRASKESAVLRVAGQSSFKEIELMIPNRTAGNSKKGGKAAPGQTAYTTWQWLGQDPLVR